MARGQMSKSNYWANRRSKQWSRFGGKLGKVYEKPTTSSIAKAAWSGVKYLRTLVNSENHKLDTDFDGNVANTGGITHVTAIGQGDGLNQRTGNSCLLSYLSLKCYITQHASATLSAVRCILFIDLQQISDTSPAIGDLLTTVSIRSHYNANNVGRFKVLYDQVYTMDGAKTKSLWIRKNFTLNRHVRFNGSATTDIQKGGIYWALLSNEATNTPALLSQVRVGWHDN